MFRTVPLSIIRSLFTVHSAMVYVIQLSSRTRMEHSSILVLLDGQTNCPEHVEFNDKINL